MSDATAASRDWEEPNSVPVCEFTREAHDGDMLVGTVIGQIYKKDDGMYLYVKSLEVHPDYRRQQVGKTHDVPETLVPGMVTEEGLMAGS